MNHRSCTLVLQAAPWLGEKKFRSFAYLPLIAEIPIIMFYYYIKASNCDKKKYIIAYISIKKRLKTWSRRQTHYCILGGDYLPLNLGALDLIHDRFGFLQHNNIDMIILRVLGKFRVLTCFVSTPI